MKRLIDELYEMYFYASDDLNYEQAIADGSWPSAVEILRERLANAEARRLRA